MCHKVARDGRQQKAGKQRFCESPQIIYFRLAQWDINSWQHQYRNQITWSRVQIAYQCAAKYGQLSESNAIR